MTGRVFIHFQPEHIIILEGEVAKQFKDVLGGLRSEAKALAGVAALSVPSVPPSPQPIAAPPSSGRLYASMRIAIKSKTHGRSLTAPPDLPWYNRKRIFRGQHEPG